MGTYQFEMWLSASNPAGDPVLPENFAHSLGINPMPYTITGLNARWANARLDVCQINQDDFSHEEEPSEAFHAAAGHALRAFASWLMQLSVEPIYRMRGDGIHLEVWIYCWITQDQFELTLPSELMTELGRLKLPLHMMTEGQ